MSKNNCNRNCRLDPAGLCGTNIDTGGVTFGDREANLVYMDKVFSFNSDTSCPVFFCVDTRCDSEDFEIKFTTADRGCGCGCNPCELDCDAVFEIENAFAVLNFIGTCPPGSISPSQVTIDGEEVDSVTFENGRFVVGISELLPRLQHPQCLNANLPSKNFLLIRDVCAWEIRATYVLEGTVTSGGRTCCFRAEIRNAEEAPSTVLPTNCCSNFAIPGFAIPCAVNGIVPDIAFHFGGNVKLVNPQLKVKCHRRPGPPPFSLEVPGLSTELFNNMNTTPSLVFKSKVVLEPSVHVECVRRTLFSVNAQEGIIPCESTASELEAERRNAVDPCNNLAGSGFHHANTCRLTSNFGCSMDSDVCGESRGDVCEELCEEICDSVLGVIDRCSDVRGIEDRNRCDSIRSCVDFEGRRCDDCMGCRDNVAGCRRGVRSDVRAAGRCSTTAARNVCQFFGSNGCCW